jgi:hypothetical protein
MSKKIKMTVAQFDEAIKAASRATLKWVEENTSVKDRDGGVELPGAVLDIVENPKSCMKDYIVPALAVAGIKMKLREDEHASENTEVR